MKLLTIVLVFFCLRVEATTYAVKAGGGGGFTTVQSCANTAVAGDTCVVYAGTYAGWTQATSGFAGSPITFTSHPGDIVSINSQVNISRCSYITISNLSFTVTGTTIQGNGTSAHNIISNNTAVSTMFGISCGLGSNGSDNQLLDNTITFASYATNAPCFIVYGDRNLFDGNTCSGGGGDFLDVGGTNIVVRNNYYHDINGSLSGEHLDLVQVEGAGTTPTLTFSLIERNVEKNCTNDSGNCHAIIIRTGTGPVADTVIYRYNYVENLDGSGGNIGGSGDDVPNCWFYNNTIVTGTDFAANGQCGGWQNAPTGAAYNNICYNVTAGNTNWSPFYDFSSGGLVENANLAYTAGYSGGWGAPYTSETTYAALHNQNPLFANYPTDGTLSSTSPARGAGVALTTVAATDTGSGTTLIVENAHGFQPGWAGIQGDWIRIGSSTTVQISAIDYNTNTITLASGISRSSGNPVYLYKDSNGSVVLLGSRPDLGAYPSVVAAPMGLAAVTH